MIVVPVKEGENIERALRQQFDKPSVVNRLAKERAIYVQKMQRVEE